MLISKFHLDPIWICFHFLAYCFIIGFIMRTTGALYRRRRLPLHTRGYQNLWTNVGKNCPFLYEVVLLLVSWQYFFYTEFESWFLDFLLIFVHKLRVFEGFFMCAWRCTFPAYKSFYANSVDYNWQQCNLIVSHSWVCSFRIWRSCAWLFP